jgi:hypothetical protein
VVLVVLAVLYVLCQFLELHEYRLDAWSGILRVDTCNIQELSSRHRHSAQITVQLTELGVWQS